MSARNHLYHIGDQVLVKKPLTYCSHGLNDDMKAMAGRVVTIERVLSDAYWIKEDPGKWHWCDLCFEPVYQEAEGDINLEGLL